MVFGFLRCCFELQSFFLVVPFAEPRCVKLNGYVVTFSRMWEKPLVGIESFAVAVLFGY